MDKMVIQTQIISADRVRLCEREFRGRRWFWRHLLLLSLAIETVFPVAGLAQGLITVRYGMVSKSGLYWAHYVGEAKGFFRDEQIREEPVLTRSSSLSVQVLIANSVDMVGVDPAPVILSVEKGSDLAIIAGQINKPTYSVVVRSDIKSIEDLRGKTLGVSNVKTGEVVFLKKALSKYGLHEGDYQLANGGGAADRFAAMQKGVMAGTVLPSPFDFRLQDVGLRILLATSEVVRDYQFLVETVRRSWAKANEPTLIRYLRALRRSYNWMNEPANREDASAILAKELNLEPRYAQRSYDTWIAKEGAYSLDIKQVAFQPVLEYLGETGELKTPLPVPKKYLDLTYLERAGVR
jgi:ABC-type nitrate/sulfonate/bicarbonate transport system substrate-binding protein